MLRIYKTRFEISIIIVLSALTWLTSITNEYTGYDDIQLIANNKEIQRGVLHAIEFYGNYSSYSYSPIWADFPSTIYRPLEWVVSAFAYSIWGSRVWCYHLFVNFSVHIVNSILIFYILSKVFSGTANSSNLSNKVSGFLPLIITILWTIHPLHNEAVNMLTSGVGFLCSCLFSLLAILINIQIDSIKGMKRLLLLVLSWIFFFLSFLGVEMLLIGPFVLLLIFSKSVSLRNLKSFNLRLYQVFFSFSALITYFLHRLNIISQSNSLFAVDLRELMERLFVLAPEVFFHYIKLFFYPLKLTIDQHHNVRLEDCFSLYYSMCLIISALFIYLIFYFFNLRETTFRTHNILIAGSLLFTIGSIVIALNIFPLYCLARERYTYFFSLGLVCAILLALDKYIFVKWRDSQSKQKNKITWLIFLSFITLALGCRSSLRSLDWSNGEKLWLQTMDSVDDIGSKQFWRYKLMQYYDDPHTQTFKSSKKDKISNDFWNFVRDNRLGEKEVFNKYLNESRGKKNYLKNKYAFVGKKSIAAALYAMASRAATEGRFKESAYLLRLSHIYSPDYFQTNLSLYMAGSDMMIKEQSLETDIFNRVVTAAEANSLWAQRFLEAMSLIDDPRAPEYIMRFKKKSK